MKRAAGVKLTKAERTLAKDLADGRYELLSPAEHARYRQAAQAQISRRKRTRKEARINIRLTREQVDRLKQRAEQDGLPYQSLLASVIQRFLNGSLVDASSLAAIRRALKAI